MIYLNMNGKVFRYERRLQATGKGGTLAVNLPSLIKQLGWEKGDMVAVEVDPATEEIRIWRVKK